MFVYKIVNIVNDKCYIGKTERFDPAIRWDEHKRKLNAGTHVNRHLLASWQKYGEQSFVFEVLETSDSIERLNQLEAEHISSSRSFDKKCGYNKTLGGEGGVPNEETRQKLSLKNRGRKLTKEHKQKLRNAHIGKKLSESAKRKLSEFWMGIPKPQSESHKEKLRKTLINNKNGRIRNEPTEFFKTCSKCSVIIYHSSQKALQRAKARTSLCRSCAHKNKFL